MILPVLYHKTACCATLWSIRCIDKRTVNWGRKGPSWEIGSRKGNGGLQQKEQNAEGIPPHETDDVLGRSGEGLP